MIKEFREFIEKGNAFDMAIAFVLGLAFKAIVDSLVNDLIMPLVSLVTGGMDLTNRFIVLAGEKVSSIEAAEKTGSVLWKYGSFIQAFINFVIIAFILFLMVKALNRLRRSKEEEVTTKSCPVCTTEIPLAAKRCPNCTSDLE